MNSGQAYLQNSNASCRSSVIMTSKMLFWLDSAITPFAIAKGISDNYDAELYAVVDITNKPKKFFQTQKIVNFSKIWFYHDHINPKSKPDVEYLSSLEEKSGINLWMLAYNERLFYNFNKYRKFTEDEVLVILEQECKLFERILDEVKPDYVIMYDTNMHHNHLFYLLCKKRGIKTLILVATRLAKRWAISTIPDNIDFVPEKLQITSTVKSFQELQTTLNDLGWYKLSVDINTKFLSSRSGLMKAAMQFLFKNRNTNIATHYSYYGRSKIKVLLNTIMEILQTKYRKKFIDSHFITAPNLSERYILFTLSQDPERSTLITAPFYTNQLELIKNIVKSLPIGYKLYVKEHQAMASREWRKISYYRELLALPNVRLIHPTVNTIDLIRNASLVISISGTSSFESIFYQVPSIVMADTSFSMISLVHKLRSIDELPVIIRKLVKKRLDDSTELSEYVNVSMKNTFFFDYDALEFEFADLFYMGSFLVDVDLSEQKISEFLERNKNITQLLATEFLKKIH